MFKTALFVLSAFAALAQTAPPARQLTARELFYAAAPVAAAPAVKPATAPAAAGKTETKSAKAPRPPAKPPAPPPSVVTRSEKAAPPAEPRTTLPGGAQYTPVTHPSQPAAPPLGLRYTILKLVDGRMTAVAPDSAFRAGDRIQVSVEANDNGYLYIVHQGTSGTWKPLFPSAEVEEGDNRVEKGRTYVMPPKSRFYFDEQAGVEKLFIVLSRRPEPDLEKLIYKLQDGSRPPEPAAPTAEPAPRRPTPLLLAANLQIDDSVVGKLRNVYARDLVIEKVDDDAGTSAADGRKEKAVYVVNPTGSPESRVVADIRLTHR